MSFPSFTLLPALALLGPRLLTSLLIPALDGSVPWVGKYGVLRILTLGYLSLLLLSSPVAMIAYRTFQHGLAPVWDALTAPFFLCMRCTCRLFVAAIVVPVNVIFGVGTAWLISASASQDAGALAGQWTHRPAVRHVPGRRRARVCVHPVRAWDHAFR